MSLYEIEGTGLSEVLAVTGTKKMREVIVKLPKQYLDDIEHTVDRNCERGEFVYVSTKRYTRHYQSNQIREAMMKGYVEMSHINLSIACECSHAEYEAEHTVERLVSGG
jgi:CopG family transcriptional regulator/antitoxin EndoAI